MNLNEAVLNRGKGNKNKQFAFKPCSMPPPSKPAPKKRGSSIASTLPWGRSRESVLNSSSVLRSGNSSKTTTSSEHETRIILALTGGRGQACFEVGLAVLDISRSNLILCQISDTPSYNNTLTKINIFDPDEILIPSTFVNLAAKNRLIELVREKFSGKKFISVARSAFNKLNGFERLQKLCLPSFNSILLSIQHKYYALSAASAVLSYAQTGLYVFYCSESIKVEYQESEGFSVIDICTADRLELVASTRPEQANKYSTLYGVVNYCITKIGSRTLRSAILQPPYNVDYINERIECVTELVNNPKLLTTIQTFLPKLASIDQLLQLPALLPGDPEHLSVRQLNYLLLLNNLLEVARPLGAALAPARHPILGEVRATLRDERLAALGDRLRRIVHEEARYASGTAGVAQRCFLIKPGINGLLDMVRRIYSERIDEMREYVKSLEQKHNLPLTLGNNSTKGYHIVLSLKGRLKYCFKKTEIPEEFIQVYRLAGSFTMKTLELLNLSTRIEDLMTDIIKISNVMIYKLLKDIKPYLDLFYRLVESVARLDMFQSLAQASVAANYVKPEFNDDFTEVKFSHHPMLDFLCTSRPVPNSYFACKDHNFHIITGPNGSGKSIFIRQVILLQVMAQIGCYVPAKSAVFRPADRIFARVYMEDDMECGVSTFTLEVKEINHIMTAMTDRSLIVMDEPCRSTNINQGAALAMAVCEKLSNRSAFIFVTTHFIVLARLQDLYLNVKVWQMETIASGETPEEMELDFKYTIVPGVTVLKDYGIYLVRNIWPASMLDDIDEMGKIFKQTSKNVDVSSIDPKTRLLYEFKAELNMLQLKGKLTKTNVNNCINKYQSSLYNYGCNLGEIEDLVNTLLRLDLQKNDFQFGIENQTESSQLEGDNLQFGNSAAAADLQEFGNTGANDYEEETYPQDALSKNSFTSNPVMDEILFQDGNSSFQKLSDFLNETPDNMNKLIPEISMRYPDSLRGNNFVSDNEVASHVFPASSADLSSQAVKQFVVNLTPTSSQDSLNKHYGRNGGNENGNYRPSGEVDNKRTEELEALEDFSRVSESFFETDVEESQISVVKDDGCVKKGSFCCNDEIDLSDEGMSESNLIEESTTHGIDEGMSHIEGGDGLIASPCNLANYNTGDDRLNLSPNSEKEQVAYNNNNNEVMNVTKSEELIVLELRNEDLVDKEESSLLGRKEEKQTHIFPIVIIREGPNNKSMSFGTEGDDGDSLYLNNTVTENVGEDRSVRESIQSLMKSPLISQKKSDELKKNQVMQVAEKATEINDHESQDLFPEVVDDGVQTIPDELLVSQKSPEGDEEEKGGSSRSELEFKDISKERNLSASPPSDETKIEEVSKLSFDPSKSKTTSKSDETSLDNKSEISVEKVPDSSTLRKPTSKRKFKPPLLNQPNSGKRASKRPRLQSKFKPPKPLTKREIVEEFNKQDQQFIEETTVNPSESHKYLERLLNRPSVQQMRNAQHVALLRKTEAGVVVIPAEERGGKRRKHGKPLPAVERFVESVDLTIFSDENAELFDQFAKSNEKDYNKFKLTRLASDESSVSERGAAQKFDFGPAFERQSTVGPVFDYFSWESGAVDFAASKRSGGVKFSMSSFCASDERDVELSGTFISLTPNEFYKENKNDIDCIIGKYNS